MTCGSFISTFVLLLVLKRISEKLGGKPPMWSALTTMGYVRQHIKKNGNKRQKNLVTLMYLSFSSIPVWLFVLFILSQI
jgi:hypothetical protein